MKKTLGQRLSLIRTTVRELMPTELDAVRGGTNIDAAALALAGCRPGYTRGGPTGDKDTTPVPAPTPMPMPPPSTPTSY
jgi:hypothetical protein